MRFTFIATLIMIGVTVGVTPGLRHDLLRLWTDAAPVAKDGGAEPASQRLARIPRRILQSLPEAEPPAEPLAPEPQRLAIDLNDLAPAAGPGQERNDGAYAASLGAVQVAALPPSADPLHDTELLRLSDLEPAAPAIPGGENGGRAGLEPQGFAVFVAIGSYDGLSEAADAVRRHADWEPMIHKAVMNERLRHVVVLGPFESGDVGAALKRLREIGVTEPWPLAIQLRPGLSVKGLEIFG